MEKNFLNQSIYEQILVQMREEDKDDALLMLPEFFSNTLLKKHLHDMRTGFARTIAENEIYFIAHKLDNAVNHFCPAGSIRRKMLHCFWVVVKFIPALLLGGLKRVYRLAKPHPDDLRKKQLSGNSGK